MIGRWWYYLKYAARNLRRSTRWTIFAIFCIAAGVAAVVALRSLGLAIGDSLVENVRQQNHGDITLSFSSSGGFSFDLGSSADNADTFTPNAVANAQQWAQQHNATFTAYTLNSASQVTPIDAVTVGRPQFVSLFLIDPETFPPTSPIELLDPAGTTLRDALAGENSIVISQNLAASQSLSVGDTVRVSGTEETFTVTGIAPTEAEAGTGNLFASFFGFAYLPISDAAILQVPEQPNTISIALPSGTPSETIEQYARELLPLTRAPNYTTSSELLESNQIAGDIIGRFIVVMGLGALLIGGVGIINTMLVMVGRRTNEIAALKTFGLKGRQVAAMFLSEALLLGIMGSIVGVVLGLLLTGVVYQYGETFLQQRLPARIYPEAILYGMVLGTVVTLVFGVLPVLTANKVRPATILRPNETALPATGCLNVFITLILVVVVIGAIAGRILGSIPAGIIGVALTLLLLAFLVGVMWVIVWFVGKLPSFGIADLRLALRNLSSRRIRTATTLLALAAGMFALSSITFVGAGTRELLNFQLTQNFGGNVLVFPLLGMVSPAIGQATVNAQVSNMQGIEYTTQTMTYAANLIAIDGAPPPETELQALMDEAPRRAQRIFNALRLQARETTNPNPTPFTVIAGRTLTPEDNGRAVMLVSDDFLTQQRGIGLGSMLTLEYNGATYSFEVVGILGTASGVFSSVGQYIIPPDSITQSPDFTLTTLQVAPENLNQALLDLSANPLIIALDISFIDSLLGRLIAQFSAIPTIVGLLSLLAAAVAMANTVSLATLERRRQIGILKAVGLKGQRVLWIMLLENTAIGLLGGFLGIGLSALGVALMTALGTGIPTPIPSTAVPVAIALMTAAVLIAWVATFLSARPAVRERVTNVLRYE